MTKKNLPKCIFDLRPSPARLFSTSGIKRSPELETRVASTTLALLGSIKEFQYLFLRGSGAPKRSKIEVFKEFEFPKVLWPPNAEHGTPDGYIVLNRGTRREWRALVEFKIGTNHLNRKQMEDYQALAYKHQIDALISISNEPSQKDSHPPVKLNSRIQKVKLVHWQWKNLIEDTVLLVDRKRGNQVEDEDQLWMLDEWFKYVNDKHSGVTVPPSLGSGLKKLCNATSHEKVHKTHKKEAFEVAQNWLGFCENIKHLLRSTTGAKVDLKGKVWKLASQDERANHAAKEILEDRKMSCGWHVKGSVGTIFCSYFPGVAFELTVSIPASGEVKPETEVKHLHEKLSRMFEGEPRNPQQRNPWLASKAWTLVISRKGERVRKSGNEIKMKEFTNDVQVGIRGCDPKAILKEFRVTRRVNATSIGKTGEKPLDSMFCDVEKFYLDFVKEFVLPKPKAPPKGVNRISQREKMERGESAE